jgi:iron complex transport system substrate-binding protein
MRICSLLPSATEILFALGLGDSVAGVTHECDFPPEAANRPALIRPRVDPQAQPAELDRQVTELVARGESIYSVDADLLGSLSPDLIVTQDLCHVCAASPDDLAAALARFAKRPKVLALTPHSLVDVWNDIRRIGDATQRRREAQGLAITLEQKVAAIEAKAARAASRPRVL